MPMTLIKTSSQGEEEADPHGKAQLPSGYTGANQMSDGCLVMPALTWTPICAAR